MSGKESYFDSEESQNEESEVESDNEEVADNVSEDGSEENILSDDDESIQSEILEKEIEQKGSENYIIDDEDVQDYDVTNEEFDVSDEEDETYLQKFNKDVNRDYIAENHPECIMHNNHEIECLASVTRDDTNSIIDDNHRSLPVLTKYERTRIIGQRAKQINQGSKPFIVIPEGILDGYIIAEMELKEKKIPFIIQRPMPNGSKEFWKVEDLEQVDF